MQASRWQTGARSSERHDQECLSVHPQRSGRISLWMREEHENTRHMAKWALIWLDIVRQIDCCDPRQRHKADRKPERRISSRFGVSKINTSTSGSNGTDTTYRVKIGTYIHTKHLTSDQQWWRRCVWPYMRMETGVVIWRNARAAPGTLRTHKNRQTGATVC